MLYKIKSKKTGLYLCGAKDPTWNKKGKVWKNLLDLQDYINSFLSIGNDWIIEEYVLEKGKTFPARSLIKDNATRSVSK